MATSLHMLPLWHAGTGKLAGNMLEDPKAALESWFAER
jgi:hypothetical protein